jgi:hypothetical protein
MSDPHVLKERLPLLLLRSQVSDAEYEHLKKCSQCVEIMVTSGKKITWREIVSRKTSQQDAKAQKGELKRSP